MDSYDNDWIGMLMDDDLFPVEAEEKERSEKLRVG